MAVRLRLRLPSGQSQLSATTWGELKEHVNTQLGGDNSRSWNLLTGYPPAPLSSPPSSDDVPLSDLFKSGETIVVKLGEAPAAPPPPPAAAPAPPPPLTTNNTNPVVDEDEDMKLALALSMGEEPPPRTTTTAAPDFFGGGDGERLVRRVIPADNSCLFAALAHAFEGSAGRRQRADGLRTIVAERVLADPIEYNEATLDREPADYAKWIQKADNWGGGIEIAILSSHFGAELRAFDIQTERVDIFGQGMGYETCALLLYDGVHYDLIVKELFKGAPEELDVCVFNVAKEGEAIMAEARMLVKEAHKKRAFTDTAKFTLRCLVCQEGLVGEKGAMEHAKKTGHGNFCEYVPM